MKRAQESAGKHEAGVDFMSGNFLPGCYRAGMEGEAGMRIVIGGQKSSRGYILGRDGGKTNRVPIACTVTASREGKHGHFVRGLEERRIDCTGLTPEPWRTYGTFSKSAGIEMRLEEIRQACR